MAVSVRLKPEEQRRLHSLARSRGITVSELIREAVGNLVSQKGLSVHPYARIADLIGSISGLPPELSERTGERFADQLGARNKKRR